MTSRPQCLQRRFEPLCQRCVVLCGFPGMGLCVAAIHLKTASPKPRNESRPHVSVDFTFRVSAAATSRSFFLSPPFPPFPLSFAGTKFSTNVRTSTYTRPCSNFDHLAFSHFIRSIVHHGKLVWSGGCGCGSGRHRRRARSRRYY